MAEPPAGLGPQGQRFAVTLRKVEAAADRTTRHAAPTHRGTERPERLIQMGRMIIRETFLVLFFATVIATAQPQGRMTCGTQ